MTQNSLNLNLCTFFTKYCHQDLHTFPNVLRLKSKLRILFHFKNVWTGNAAQSDEYIYFDDFGEIAKTGYSADLILIGWFFSNYSGKYSDFDDPGKFGQISESGKTVDFGINCLFCLNW